MNDAPVKFYNKTWFIWVTLILFAPLGLFLLWKNKKYNRTTRLVLTTVFSLFFLFGVIPSNNTNTPNNIPKRNNPIQEPTEKIPGNPGNSPASPLPGGTGTNEALLDAVEVVRTVDGDTIEVRFANGRIEKVRLIGINTSESTTRHEPYGDEASDFTKKSLSGKTVYLEKDVSERDKYGRLLRLVWLQRLTSTTEDDIRSKMFNSILVLKGYAQVSTYPPDVKYAEYFTKFAREAREAGIGLWSVNAVEKTPTRQPAKKPSPTKAPPNTTKAKIKGNINSKGEKIYHIPGGAYYDRTIAEEYFETEAEAQAAGYRRSKR